MGKGQWSDGHKVMRQVLWGGRHRVMGNGHGVTGQWLWSSGLMGRGQWGHVAGALGQCPWGAAAPALGLVGAQSLPHGRTGAAAVPPLPILNPGPPLEEGQGRTLAASCTAEGSPVPSVRWETDVRGTNATRRSEHARSASVTSEFFLVPGRSMNGKSLTCVVEHPGLRHEKRITHLLSVACGHRGTGDTEGIGDMEGVGDMMGIEDMEGVGDIGGIGDMMGIGDMEGVGDIGGIEDTMGLGNMLGIGGIGDMRDIEGKMGIGDLIGIGDNRGHWEHEGH